MKKLFFALVCVFSGAQSLSAGTLDAHKGFGGFSVGAVFGGGSHNIGVPPIGPAKGRGKGMLGGIDLTYGIQTSGSYLGLSLLGLLSGVKAEVENTVENPSPPLTEGTYKSTLKQKAAIDLTLRLGQVVSQNFLAGLSLGATMSFLESRTTLTDFAEDVREIEKRSGPPVGFGGGVFGVYKLSDKISAQLRYDYRTYRRLRNKMDLDSHVLLAGLNYHF